MADLKTWSVEYTCSVFFFTFQFGPIATLKETDSFVNMDPYTGNSASAAAPKKDKKSKKNYEDGDGKKKFVSIFSYELLSFMDLNNYR